MKLNENLDYVYLTSRMQSKYDDKDYLPNVLKSSIKGILKLCEEQEKAIEKLKKPKFIFNAETGVVTKLENDCNKDKIRNKINELTLKNKIPIKDQFVMYDVIKRNFQIEILEEILNEEGEPDAK